MAMLRQFTLAPSGERRLQECENAFVSSGADPVHKTLEPNGDGNQQYAQHQAKLRIVCKMSSTSEVKGIQQYSEG
jgi:hypothetical protein